MSLPEACSGASPAIPTIVPTPTAFHRFFGNPAPQMARMHSRKFLSRSCVASQPSSKSPFFSKNRLMPSTRHCHIRPANHHSSMNSVLWLPSSLALILILAGCSSNNSTLANDPLGTGPFDSRGNYREDWADDPSKWRRPSSRQTSASDDLPQIAKNEQPPATANPLAPQAAKPTSSPTNTRANSTPRETASRPQTSKPVASKPKPTVVKAKPKPKPQPKSIRYVVKKGDSLSAIATRNGSSVAAIRKANGISGTLIHPGQKLVVPKR